MAIASRVVFVAAALLALVSLATAAEEKQVKVMMLGDSVTLGMPDAVGGPLNDLTKGQIKWTMVNAGGPGESADGGKLRISKLLADNKPDVVTISYGLNDVSKHIKPETFKSNMSEIIAIINKEAPATKVVLLTCTPFDIYHHFNGKDKAYNAEGGADLVLDRKYNWLTRELAATKPLPLIDLHRYCLTEKDFATKYIHPEGQLHVADGVHLKPEGYKFVGPYVAKALAAWYETELAKDAQGIALRDKMVARLKKVAAKAGEAKDSATRKKLLAELDEVWQAAPWLPVQAALWQEVYYAGFVPQPVNPQPETPASSAAPAKTALPAGKTKP